MRLDLKGGLQPLKLPPGRYETRGSPRTASISPSAPKTPKKRSCGFTSVRCELDAPAHGAGKNRYPIWSADGERVAFQSDREGDVAIFWQRADGTGPPNASPGQSLGLRTSRNRGRRRATGSCSVCSERVERTVSLWTFSLRDRKAEPFGGVQLSTANLARSVFSPDGRWVAYMSDETGMTAVYVQPVPATGAKYPISKVGPPLPCGCRMERESFTLIRKPHLQEARDSSS